MIRPVRFRHKEGTRALLSHRRSLTLQHRSGPGLVSSLRQVRERRRVGRRRVDRRRRPRGSPEPIPGRWAAEPTRAQLRTSWGNEKAGPC